MGHRVRLEDGVNLRAAFACRRGYIIPLYFLLWRLSSRNQFCSVSKTFLFAYIYFFLNGYCWLELYPILGPPFKPIPLQAAPYFITEHRQVYLHKQLLKPASTVAQIRSNIQTQWPVQVCNYTCRQNPCPGFSEGNSSAAELKCNRLQLRMFMSFSAHLYQPCCPSYY